MSEEVKEECQYCIKYKTMYCPNSNECYSLPNLPHFMTKLDTLKQLQAHKEKEDKLREYLNECERAEESPYRTLIEQILDGSDE